MHVGSVAYLEDHELLDAEERTRQVDLSLSIWSRPGTRGTKHQTRRQRQRPARSIHKAVPAISSVSSTPIVYSRRCKSMAASALSPAHARPQPGLSGVLTDCCTTHMALANTTTFDGQDVRTRMLCPAVLHTGAGTDPQWGPLLTLSGLFWDTAAHSFAF